MYYTSRIMARSITMSERDRGGAYADVIEIAELLGKRGQFGSNVNALAHMARQSPLFQEAIAQITKERKPKARAC